MGSVSKFRNFTKGFIILGIMVMVLGVFPTSWADEDDSEDDQGGDANIENSEEDGTEPSDNDDDDDDQDGDADIGNPEWNKAKPSDKDGKKFVKNNPAPRYGFGGILALPLSLPAGTAFKATLRHPLDADINRVGDPVRLTLVDALSVEGIVIARPSSIVEGVVDAVRPADRRGIPAYIQVRIYTLKPSHGEFTLPINAVMDVPDNTVGRRFGGKELGLNSGKVLVFILDESMTIGPEYLEPPNEWDASRRRRSI